MSSEAERSSDKMQVSTTIIAHVIGLKVKAELLLPLWKAPVPREVFYIYKWPVTCPEKLVYLQNILINTDTFTKEL